MCTVSWLMQEGGYLLFSNRDEKRTRMRAAPPRIQTSETGTRVITPTDGDFGGSWISVNDNGLSLCLLNRYQDRIPDRIYTSRGHVVLNLSDAQSAGEAVERLASSDLNIFRPFTLLVLSLSRAPLLAQWDGVKYSVDEASTESLPLVSTSVSPEEVNQARRELFRHQVLLAENPGAFRHFHSSHLPASGPFSVCMHRQDAETVSFSQISVNMEAIEFLYHEGPPCRPVAPWIVRIKMS